MSTNSIGYTDKNLLTQREIKQSLKDMYLRNIHFNEESRKIQKANQIREEREKMERLSEKLRQEDEEKKIQKKIIQKEVYSEYLRSNNLLTENPLSKSMKLRRENKLNNDNISNKICRNYYIESKELFDNKVGIDMNSQEEDYKNKGKRMHNFVDMGEYSPGAKYKKAHDNGDYDIHTAYNLNQNNSVEGQIAAMRNLERLKQKNCNYGIYRINNAEANPYKSEIRQPLTLGNSTLKQNPILNPVNYYDEARYNGYKKFLLS